MKPVMIFCPTSDIIESSTYNNFSLSCALIKKHFGEVHLVGNKLGVDFLKNLSWTSTSDIIEDLPTIYKSISGYTRLWGLSYFSKLYDSFIHVDSDCFLWEKPDDDILTSDIFFLCSGFVDPNIKKIMTESLDVSTIGNDSVLLSPNIGICGKNNNTFFEDYCDKITEMISEAESSDYWKKVYENSKNKSIIIENYLLGYYLNKLEITPSLIFPNRKSPNATFCQITNKDAESNGITRLGEKLRDDASIQKSITERLSQKPPNLAMKKNAGVPQIAVNFVKSMTTYAIDGFKNATQQLHDERLKVCLQCEFWSQEKFGGLGKCEKCGCSGAKLWVLSSKCPLNKWEIDTEESV